MIPARLAIVPARWPELCLLLWVALSGSAAAQTSAQASSTASFQPSAGEQFPISSEQILGHIRHVLDWYHHVTQIEQLPGATGDLVSRDRLRDQALTAVRLTLEMGKAAAPLVTSGPKKSPGEPTSVVSQLQQATSELDSRASAIESELVGLRTEINRATPAARKTLISRRDNLAASLGLVREGQATVQQMLEFAARSALATGEGQRTLAGQVAELERSLPQAAPSSPAVATAGTAAATPFHTESAGIIALVNEAFAVRGTQRQMASLSKETDALLAELKSLRAAVAAQAREILEQSLAAARSMSPEQVPAQRQAIDSGTARFKALSAVVVPLGEQAVTLANARTTLDEWSRGVDLRLHSVTRYFALRLAVLLASVLAVLIFSDVWRRATQHYVRDPSRRRPLLILRRLVVGLALAVVVAFGLASEVGSLATFMGFLTAGIALSLQNVILSVVAYFFLIGRYGVQVGERITLVGVTGRVVDVSLLRLYLLEVAGADLHSTGRLVVLSNAVLFQPTALYKQIPGADYVWHTVTVTATPSTDIQEASRRLSDAARAVFDEYQPLIEKHHARMQAHIDFETDLPQPEVQVEVADDGLHCAVRYPVSPSHAAAIDQQMLEALREAFEKDGDLKLAASGGVTLKVDS
jgi:small-conductance mechanosensitive channel